MQMRPGRVACRADTSDLVSGPNRFADLDVDSREVCIHRSNSTPVGDDDELPPATCHDSGPGDSTGRGGGDGCTPPGGEVDSAVEAEPARPERRGDRRANRPREPDRAVRELPRLERAERLRSGDAGGSAAASSAVTVTAGTTYRTRRVLPHGALGAAGVVLDAGDTQGGLAGWDRRSTRRRLRCSHSATRWAPCCAPTRRDLLPRRTR